jgi:signal transduction histidine kinase/DNA-binding LacI/PurR family transcriptional regulator/AraC-like DNA-binding protein
MEQEFRHGRPTIGVLAGWQFYRTATNLSYLAPIYRGIAKAAGELGCNLLLGCGMGPSASPTDPLKAAWPVLLPDQDFVPIGAWNTDGLIVAVPLHSKAHSDYIQDLRKSGHPVIFIGSGEPGPTIAADNAGGIIMALQHLFQLGHRKIAFIAGSQTDMEGDSGERLRAYHAFMESHNLNQDSRLVAFSQHVYSGGDQAIREILAFGADFTAVVASNDEAALGAMDALLESGYRIPEDVAIIGFDNRFEGVIQEPSLTSVHVPLYDIGYSSAKLLFEGITGTTLLPQKVMVETQLVIRQSCGGEDGTNVPDVDQMATIEKESSLEDEPWDLVASISHSIMKEVRNFSEDEIVSFSKQLVDNLLADLQSGDPTKFHEALMGILKRTEDSGDVVYIWQKALKRLDDGFKKEYQRLSPKIDEIINEARAAINYQMQLQYRRHVLRERWVSSRLSLLTAELLTALGKEQIFSILSKRLPELEIPIAHLTLFEGNTEISFAISTIRDVLNPHQAPVRFASRNFPPRGYFTKTEPFLLTLIPILDQERQLGFMVFDTDHLDVYGSIVQQMGSALNTLRLYRQATEGRKQAEEANKLKSRFLSMISHELRTPLSLISGLSEIVLQDVEEEQTQVPLAIQKDVSNIKSYAQHINSLIGDVIDLAILDAGQLRLNKELIDLGETLQMVVESGQQLAFEKGLDWYSNIPQTGPWVWGDRTRLRQVVLNLISNAIKFTEQGEIKLAFIEKDDVAVISVQDTGIGIPLDEHGEIFDAFRRSERSIHFGLPGLGLGLTICKMIVEMHDGKIGFKSSGIEGEGSTFFVELPIVMLPTLDMQVQEEIGQRSERSVLLLTTRPGSNLDLLGRLKARDIKVYEGVLGEPEIWQSKLNSISPDIIILDVTVQSDLTWQTLNAIKGNKLTHDIPTMLYSSSDKNESLLRLNYLTKPFEVDALTRALDQHWDIVDKENEDRTILVVDDDPNALDLYARVVKSQSVKNEILLANNGMRALEIIREKPVDLVLLDLQMPKMDGFEVLEVMREDKVTSNIPVIVITGIVLTEKDMARLNEGVAVILQKGLFSIEETADHIEATLNQKQKLSNETQYLIRQAMAFIHEHFRESITRKEIAKHINISKDYLTFCFRQELNTTPIKYLQRYRINAAKSALKNTQKSITEIALEVGFSESGYFSRLFRREVGMSPDQYRHSSKV